MFYPMTKTQFNAMLLAWLGMYPAYTIFFYTIPSICLTSSCDSLFQISQPTVVV